jgi:hypothetical protein
MDYMSYDIVVRFPNKEVADEFCGQMSDGFGEGLCDFSFHKQKEGTDGTENSHYEEVYDGENGTRVYFVNEVFKF